MNHSASLHPPDRIVIQSQGRLLDLTDGVIMGILNVTPDSFYDGGKFTEESIIIERVATMVADGASIIDIGGMSSRPGSRPVPEEEERKRVIPVIKTIRKHFPDIFISIDTWRSQIANESLDEGADIINDISAGNIDPEIIKLAGRRKAPYILMHMQGDPSTMQQAPTYKDILYETGSFFARKTAELTAAGCTDIILDPGFGFGKTAAHNYQLLKNTGFFKTFGRPLLHGFSRKSMVNKILGTKPDEALNGTTVLNTIALLSGVQILRVHDVKEAMEALKITRFYNSIQA